jgi:RimJ/RimL family protein N-acetyltransferase
MLYLRALNDDDIYTVENWLAQDYILQWFGNISDWMEEILGRNDQYHFIKHFIVEENGTPIGFCQYYNWNEAYKEDHEHLEPAGTFGIDYLIGDASMLGKGRGKQIINLICNMVLSQELDTFQILADPMIKESQKNIASIKALEANGFKYDGKANIFRKMMKSIS